MYRIAWLSTLLMVVLWAAPSMAADPQGFLYGEVTTDSGSTYKGRIRWGNEEAFWGDMFNSTKDKSALDYELPRRERPRRTERIKVLGIPIGTYERSYEVSRAFKTRFGDIDRIEVGRGDEAILYMKSGSEYELDGGSNDLGAKIQIWDPAIGEIELTWSKIETIQFLPTPKGLDVDVFRLYGTVETDVGQLQGPIQWDQDEGVSSDKLDGDSRDGKLALKMGSIRSIERRSRRSSLVTLKDGREFTLDGSNDVNDENRGIFVEDERYGRVLVPWEAFESVEFSEPGDSGPAYKDFAPGKKLRGKVVDMDGHTHRGRIVYDLDESESWELLDGNWRDVEYAIPMGMVASVIPQRGESVEVILRNGEKLELEDTADTGDGNAGVLVIDDQDHSVYLRWEDVERIDFDR